MLGEGAWFMKVTDDSGKTLSYAQWKMPDKVWEQLKRDSGGSLDLNVTDEMRRRFQEEADVTCDVDGEPKGLRLDIVEWCTPRSEAAKAQAFPKDEEYISMLGFPTL